MRISESGQITIPKELRDRFGLHGNTLVILRPTEEGLLIQKCVDCEDPLMRVAGILDKDALGKGVSVDQYIDEVRRGR